MSKPLQVLGVISPSAYAVATGEQSDVSLVKLLAPGVAGGIAGYTIWKEHKVLGFLLGDSLGMNAYRLYRGHDGDRTLGLCNIGVTAAVVTGSLLNQRHPFWGAIGGLVVGCAITALVPGSNAHKLFNK